MQSLLQMLWGKREREAAKEKNSILISPFLLRMSRWKWTFFIENENILGKSIAITG